MADKCTWKGASGKEYLYTIYTMGTDWNDVAGNYIFAKETSPHNWEAVYIDETGDHRYKQLDKLESRYLVVYHFEN